LIIAAALTDTVPHDLAAYITAFETALAAGLITIALWYRRGPGALRWGAGAAIVVLGSLVLAFIGSRLYFLPPVKHISHATRAVSNSFPSHHALLAAANAALVLLLRPSWAVPFVGCAAIVDVALVVARDHHVIDVLASDVFVGIALAVALLVTARAEMGMG
jgi:PAP2 superfamily